MSELVSNGSKYTDDVRKQAVALYAIKGTISYVSRELCISQQTLHDWKKQDWWHTLLEQVRNENQDEHISSYHEITRKALAKADQAIDSLPDDLTAADIKALVVTGATATDKARLLQNMPTSIKGDSSSMQELADQFKQLSKQWTEKQVNVVAVQQPDDGEE